MVNAEFLQWTPLLTAAAWLAVVAYQVYRDRYRTWTEAFFVVACFSFAGYALSDFLFFNARTPELARIAGFASLVSVMMSGLFWMLHGVVLYTRMRRALFLAFLPALAFLPLILMHVVVGVVPIQGDAPPYQLVYDSTWFAAWVALLLAYALTAVVTYYWTYREVARHSPKLARRMRDLLLAIIVAVILGGATNTALGLFGVGVVPLYSTLLVFPGIMAFFAISPMSYRGLAEILWRWKARSYDLKSAILLYQDGTIIGSKVDPSEGFVDQDLFAATLDVIQNFMRTSFPGLRGKWLRSIVHGDYELAIERGDFVYLVAVLRGQENDFLRVRMREEIRKFEAHNRTVLDAWKGEPAEAIGTDAMLTSFFGAGEGAA